MPSAGAAPILGRMSPSDVEHLDVLVVGAGPAGVVAAVRAARLGARTALITRDALGGIAAHDGPVPVRTLAHAARLIREARQLSRYGITAGEPGLDYPRLLERVREVTGEVSAHALLREELRTSGVAVHEHAGAAGFVDAHTVATANGPVLQSDRFIICTGGMSRRLPLPGFELTSTHSDAWRTLLGATVDARRRRRRDRRAARFHLQRLRVAGHPVRGRAEDPDERGPGRRRDGQRRAVRVGDPRPGGRRIHRALRALRHRRPAVLRRRGCARPDRRFPRCGRGWLGGQHRRPQPRCRRGPHRRAGLRRRWMPSFARRRRTCSPPAT